MHSDVVPARPPLGRRRSPLGTALRSRPRRLVAVFVLGLLLTTGCVALVAATVDLSPWLGSVSEADPTGSLSTLRLALEAGLLGGLAATALAVTARLVRDRRVRPARAVGPLAAAGCGFVSGVLVAVAVLPALLTLRTGATGVPLGSAVDPTGVAELVCFFPLGVGVGTALPGLLVAAVRAGAVPRYTSTRQRGFVALAVVTLAATHSPADLPTFALLAAPPLGGFGLGVAWLEFA
ncbi:preprotein translocase subunit TatC [Salinigranum rubrum]|uniref:Preprotein translocase subunit TatC n=1 Tax=Salinigranum rubrum TaxID=755307 RepID=A0A2I8VL42_9EURY|nr:twin-arginine translocase subunit TatC [Salinigranum rubrum]AUV82646.1 preprotein translocase subunit TatC [Salinigranum rubrum]